MNIDDFSEIDPGRSRRISAIFKKISRIFKPWFDQVSLLRGTTFRLETNSLSTNARGRGDIYEKVLCSILYIYDDLYFGIYFLISLYICRHLFYRNVSCVHRLVVHIS
jgi:hypothetical protein